MVEDHKKNESECKSEIKRLEKRILALEKVLMSFTYNSEMGSGHPDDGGWFD